VSTLIFHHGALGDGVLIWPLLRALAPCTLIGPREKARLAQAHIPGVEALAGGDGDSPEFSRLFVPAAPAEVSDHIRQLLGAAHRVISFVSSGRDAWADNMRLMAPAAECAFVQPRPPIDHVEPVMRFHLRQLLEQGVDVDPVMPAARVNPDGPVVIHPGSGGRDKCWPAERVEALLDHLRAIGRPACVVIGEVERERVAAEVIERWRDLADVIEPGSLMELARVIGAASVYVGNDSGPTHLAAQLGVTTVALFGPSDPRVWAPVGPRVRVLWPGEIAAMNWLPVEAVAEAIAF
jgi:hypothetical protein